MRGPNENDVNGKLNQAAGKLKEGLGRVAGDPNLEAEGADQRAAGDLESGLGKVRRKVSEGIDKISDKINGR